MMLCNKDTVKATGLNIWFSGDQDHPEPQVDVIAVQGLGADPYFTWVRKLDSTNGERSRRWRRFDLLRGRKNAQADDLSDVAQTASEPVETMWLRDLLPNFVPHARIASYSYESDWRRADVQTSLRRCGEQLLNVLHQNRLNENEYRRPLVFIGHSLGGLIIKQALVLANHGGEFNNIRSSTAGIIFLGTPHRGSDAAVYGLWLAQAMRHDKTLLESLKRNSPALNDIERDFETSYHDADIVCFYENKEASYGPWRTQLVDQQSATLNGRRMIYLSTDHSGLNKFYGSEDENFCLIRPEIQRMVQTAPAKIDARYRSHSVNNAEGFRIGFSLQGHPVVSRFVARDAEMNQLRQALLPASTNEVRRKVFILHGLGGIGKSQLAVEFARKYQTSYDAIFWIDGSTKEKVRQSIANLASRLPKDQVSERIKIYLQDKSSDIDEVLNEVLKWLSQPLNKNWLLIFDNVDREFSASSRDLEAFDVKRFFPEADQGSILVTSRLARLWRLGTDSMKLEPVNELQGESILKNTFGKSIEGSSKLIKLLQGLPLAINQAGSYMRETGTNVADYMKLYDRAWKKLMTSQEDSDCSVLTTWTVSFDHLRAQSEEAANLLLLCAFFDNQDLWYELFTPALNEKIVHKMPDWFVKCVGNELDFKECIKILLKYSFIDAKTESSSFSIHSVFHHWCFHAIEEDKAGMSHLALIIVASAAPQEVMPYYTLTKRRLLPHCDRVFALARQETFNDEMDLQWQNYAYHSLGSLYLHQGRIKEAEYMYLRALAGYEKALGAEHLSTLDTVHSLGILYMDHGKIKEAEDMFLRALAGKEKALGAEHSSTLDTVHSLGSLYMAQGKINEAEDMFLRALAGKEKALGAEHLSTLGTVHSLGILYMDHGKIKEAEDMFLRALAGKEKALGAEHSSTLGTVHCLGILYMAQGKINEAEDMYLRALAGYEKVWGAEHKRPLDTRFNMAILYHKKHQFHDVMKQLELVVEGYTKLLGPDNWETVEALERLNKYKANRWRLKLSLFF